MFEILRILFNILNVASLVFSIYSAVSYKRKFVLYGSIGIIISMACSNIVSLFYYSNSLISTIINTILSMLPFVAIAFITYCKIYKEGVKFPHYTRFIPAAILIFANLLKNITTSIIHNLISSIIISIVPSLLLILLTSMILSEPKPKAAITNGEYIDLFKHILLLIFTFGIYYLVWIYKTTIYTNNYQNEEYRNPTNKLLLCIFVPFYNIYWVYKTAQRIDKLAKEKGISSDIATVSLILAPIIIQSKINELLKPVANKVPKEPIVAVNTTVPNASSVADELLKFKSLLDQGAITHEEYDKKKSQLLNQ